MKEPLVSLSKHIDRHPLASVGSLVIGLRCSWCQGSAAMPQTLSGFEDVALRSGEMPYRRTNLFGDLRP
jgi:hypothetical protein